MRLYYYGPKLRDFEFPLAKHVEMSLPNKYDYIPPFMAEYSTAPCRECFILRRSILEHDLWPLPAEPNLVSYKGQRSASHIAEARGATLAATIGKISLFSRGRWTRSYP